MLDNFRDVHAIANEEYFGITAFTALMLASREGHLDVVKFLVDKGADINAVTTTEDEEAVTALMLASRRGHFDIVKFLVESGADTEVADQEGKTAKDYAIKSVNKQFSDYIEALLKYNPFTSKSYKSTFTYFTQAKNITSQNAQLPAIKGLLKKEKNGIDDIGDYRQTTEAPDKHLEITIDLTLEENKLVFS